MPSSFSLHPQLAQDTISLGYLPLCQLLLMNDANYPWLIAVPQRNNVSEIFELNLRDQMQLMRESVVLGRTLMTIYQGDKLNIGALGNIVPQLHLHHIVRRHNDPAWPAPVWGHQPAIAYNELTLSTTIQKLTAALKAGDEPFLEC